MIPLKLHLKNFISYGATPQIIDFEPYRLICLSGKNGHGKSALLDAITWALWGQARKVAGATKADEGLLRLGQTSMMASLDFSCNREVYRVRREYTHGAKAYTSLDFGIIDQATGLFKPLTDKTIRATQEKLEAIIGLDFESFVNSAFIKQGQSNEFSKKSPKDRKEILASILGLGQFELLRKKASDKSRQALQQKEYLSTLSSRLFQEIEQNQSLEVQLLEITHALADLQAQELTFKRALQDTINQQQSLAPTKLKKETLTIQHEEITQKIDSQRTVILEEIAVIRSLVKKQRATTNYQNLEEERLRINQELHHIQRTAQEWISLKEAYLQKRQALTDYENMMNLQHATIRDQYKTTEHQFKLVHQSLENKITELAQQCASDNIELIKIDEHATILTRLIQTFESSTDTLVFMQQEKQFDKRKATYHTFITRGNLLTSELANTKHIREFTHDSINPACFLCHQDLTHEKKQILVATLDCKTRKYTHQRTRLTKLIKTLKGLIVEQHSKLEVYRAHAQEIAIKKNQLEDLVKTRIKIDESLLKKQHTLLENHQALSTSCDHLAAKQQEYALFEHHAQNYKHQDTTYQLRVIEIDTLAKQLDALKQNTTHETALHTRLQEIITLQQDSAQITKINILKDQRKHTLSETIKTTKQLKQKSQEIIRDLTACAALLTDDLLLTQKETDLQIILTKISSQKELLIHQQGALEQQQKFFTQRALEYNNYQTTIKELEKTAHEYVAIAQALSKDGIQALLIEDAIPEIEHEANALLARLTDNQAQLSIESLRDLRSGGTKETLDIKISDTVGVRPYELFSGGEAFRIDFALRIALSKLLARRSGTPLQTLIIDEGFGSQDEEGLAHIMESLYKIQDEFAKIIIVSHLPTLKDQFPVHFLVTKGTQGSTIKIVEQG